MNLLATDVHPLVASARLPWDSPAVTVPLSSGGWLRGTRRQLVELRDEQGHPYPLRGDIWVNVCPSRASEFWRAEAEAIGPIVVGRGPSATRAFSDWRKRLQTMIQRYLELRPFEMTTEDQEFWTRLQGVIDIARYRATKPITVRQMGMVAKRRGGLVGVKWEDGSYEKVDATQFDEAFGRYPVGRWFEATITRHPLTFRIIRADALRKLPAPSQMSDQQAEELWLKIVGPS